MPLFEHVFELADKLITTRAEALAAARGDLLFNRKVACLRTPLHRLHHGLVTLEGFRAVLAHHGDRLEVRKAAALARQPRIDLPNEPRREHLPDRLDPAVAARPRPRAHPFSSLCLRQVTKLTGQLEQLVEDLTLLLFLGAHRLARDLEPRQKHLTAPDDAAPSPSADGRRPDT